MIVRHDKGARNPSLLSLACVDLMLCGRGLRGSGDEDAVLVGLEWSAASRPGFEARFNEGSV